MPNILTLTLAISTNILSLKMIIEKYEVSPELMVAGQNHNIEADLADSGWSLHSEYLHNMQPTIDDGMPKIYSAEPWSFVVDALKEEYGIDSVRLCRNTIGDYVGALIFLPTEQLELARLRTSEISL